LELLHSHDVYCLDTRCRESKEFVQHIIKIEVVDELNTTIHTLFKQPIAAKKKYDSSSR